LFVSDSHIRDRADKSKDNLNKMYSVIVFVKSGANINALSSFVELMAEFLTHNYVIVFFQPEQKNREK
jgi:uncharacterized protein YozE (UPF0346 family)